MGISYLVIAVGSRKDLASEDELEALRQFVEERTGLVVAALSARQSDRLTLSLILKQAGLEL